MGSGVPFAEHVPLLHYLKRKAQALSLSMSENSKPTAGMFLSTPETVEAKTELLKELFNNTESSTIQINDSQTDEWKHHRGQKVTSPSVF